MFSQARGFSESEEEALGRIMSSFYADFVSKVAEQGGMAYEKAEEVARGRVWTGSRAKALGLIDDIGGIVEAIEAAAKEAGMKPEEVSCVKVIPKPRTFRFPMPKLLSHDSLGSSTSFLKDVKGELLFLLMPFAINMS
jgi:protease-4